VAERLIAPVLKGNNAIPNVAAKTLEIAAEQTGSRFRTFTRKCPKTFRIARSR
jgi:hypothetical protein